MNDSVSIQTQDLGLTRKKEKPAEIKKSIKWHMRMPKVLKSLTNPQQRARK